MKLSKYAKKQIGKTICDRKKQYKTRKSAWQSSLYLFIQHGFFNTVYRCRYCNLFHLTTKNESRVPDEFIKGLAKWFGMKVEEMEKVIYRK